MITYMDSREVFPTVEIKGGLCYYLRDSQYSGDCAYSLIKEGQRKTAERNLGDFDVLIREPVLAGIVKKVMENRPTTVETLISGDTPFGIPTNPKSSKKNSYTIFDTPSKTATTKVFYIEGSERKVGYIDKSTIIKNATDIDSEKVFIPEAYGAGETFPHQILGVPEYGGKNAICSQSYLYAIFEDDVSAINFISYLKCKFFRALVLSVKISQHAPSKTYRFVPLQDFSKPWTDAELYEKYGLTDEEIAFISTWLYMVERLRLWQLLRSKFLMQIKEIIVGCVIYCTLISKEFLKNYIGMEVTLRLPAMRLSK